MLPFLLVLFTLTESPADITHRLGTETASVVSAPSWRLLQFHDKDDHGNCDGEYAYQFFYEVPSGRLLSVTQNFESPVTARKLAGDKASWTHRVTRSGYALLTTDLPGGRLLILPGVTTDSEPVAQAQLIRAADLKRLYPEIQ
jgi:hypothetical protein